MHSTHLTTLAVVVATAAAQTTSPCTASGTQVTVSGFIMDNFCIDRGTLFDNSDVVTLKGPDVHSVHCLVDVSSCVKSLYAVLSPPSNGSDLYSVRYQLGQAGTDIAKRYAESARTQGGKAGFSATVSGVDDGTKELKCVSLSTNVVVDGKPMTLTMTSGLSPTSISLVTLVLGCIFFAL